MDEWEVHGMIHSVRSLIKGRAGRERTPDVTLEEGSCVHECELGALGAVADEHWKLSRAICTKHAVDL